jgi:hypothetical protein
MNGMGGVPEEESDSFFMDQVEFQGSKQPRKWKQACKDGRHRATADSRCLEMPVVSSQRRRGRIPRPLKKPAA